MAVRLRRGLQLVRAFYATKPFPPSKSFSSSSGNLISQNLRGCSQLWRLIPSLGPSQFLFGRRMVSTLGPLYSPVDTEGSGGGRSILFEGCDYEHWLITMEFPDPQPTREEKIDTFVKTLAKVVGTEEEAKKRIYALSTTTYTGFQAQISEETSEKMKGLPGVVWVLPDSYIDPVNKEYGGDKYINGVIIPDTRVYNNRPSGRYSDRPRNRMRRDSMPIERRDGLQGDRKDYRSPMEGRGYIPGGDRQDYRPTPMEGRGPMPGDRQEYRPPPMDGRGPVPGDRQDYRAPPMDERGPIPGDRQDYRAPPMDGRGPIPGVRQDYRSPPVDGRGPIPGDRQDYRPPPVDGRGPMPGDRQDYRPPPVDGRGPMPWDRQDYRPPPVDVRGPMPWDRQDYRPPLVGGSGPMPGDRQDYRPSPVDGRGPMPGDRQDYRPSPVYGSGPMPGGQQDNRPSPIEGRGPVSGYRQDYRQPMDGRGPMPHDRPSGPMQGGPMQQEDRDYGFPRESLQGGSTSAQGRDPVQVEQQPFPWPMDGGR